MNTAQNPVWRERVSELAKSLLVGGLMACLAVTVVQFGERINPAWEGSSLVIAGFLVSLESGYTHRVRRGKISILLSPEWALYRAAEWVILLTGLKLLQYLPSNLDRLLIDLPLWRQDFWENFLTGEYTLSAVVAFLIWVISAEFTIDLVDLEDEDTLPSGVMPGDSLRSRAQIRQRIASRILIVGAGMIILTALLRIDWQASWMPGPPPRGGSYNLMAYFLLGLVLLSLTQYSTLRMRWQQENIPFSGEIAARWLVYSVILIFGVAVIAILLPTHYSIGLLTGLGYLIYFLIVLLRVLWFLLLLPFFLLLALVARLFIPDSAGKVRLPPLEALPRPPAVGPGEAIPWLEALKSLLFWAVFIGVILFSVRYYLQEHPELVEWARTVRGLQWLRGLWRLLRRINQRMGAAIRDQIRSLRREHLPKTHAGRPGYLGLRRLTTRQQVMFFYGAFLRRGGEQGRPRRPAETPFEYSESLTAGLPALREDPSTREGVRSLTESFVDARFSRHEVTPAQVSLARLYWERIRKALRRRTEAGGQNSG